MTKKPKVKPPEARCCIYGFGGSAPFPVSAIFDVQIRGGHPQVDGFSVADKDTVKATAIQGILNKHADKAIAKVEETYPGVWKRILAI